MRITVAEPPSMATALPSIADTIEFSSHFLPCIVVDVVEFSDLIRFQNFTPRKEIILLCLVAVFVASAYIVALLTFESNVLKLCECVCHCNYSRKNSEIYNKFSAGLWHSQSATRTQNTNNIFFKRFHLNRNQRRYTYNTDIYGDTRTKKINSRIELKIIRKSLQRFSRVKVYRE